MVNVSFCACCGGALDEREVEGRLRRVCSRCGTVSYQNPIPATAIVVFRGRQVLLVRRSQPPQVGSWCLPGGFLECDELPEEGALRELREETGLEGGAPELLGLEISPNALYGQVLLAGYEASVPPEGVPKAGDDSSEAAFFPLDGHPALAFASHQRILDRAVEKRFPHHRPLLPRGAYVITVGDHLALAERACRAGARVLQYRNKRAPRRERLEEARRIRVLTAAHGVLMVVNDDPDLAVMVGADGVHLGQEDWPVEEVRRLLPARMLLGLSTHSLEQAREAAARGVDYLGIGPVYPTPTKPDYPSIGWETVRSVLEEVALPAVVIGGLEEEDLDRLRTLGARHAALVRAVDREGERLIPLLNSTLEG